MLTTMVKKSKQAFSKNLISNAGEYYVCAELCRRNILALLTPKNNPLFDITASDPQGKRTVYIQVKTMGLDNNDGWLLGKKITAKQKNPNLYIVLVNMNPSGENDYYIYEYDVFAAKVGENYKKYISTPKRDGSNRKEMKGRWYKLSYFNELDKQSLNNWELLGF